MPIYEYECQICHKKTEALQKMDDAPVTYCEECKSESLVRVISGGHFELDGHGWPSKDWKLRGH